MKIIILYFNGSKSYLTWYQLGMIVSVLKEKFESVTAINVEEKNLLEYTKLINAEQPDVLLCCLKFKVYDIFKRFLKEVNTNKINHISVFSSLPNIFPEKVLEENKNIHSAIYGEIEETVIDLIMRIKDHDCLEGCKGVVYRGQNGKIIKNEKRESIKNLDQLPFADRECFSVDKRFFHVLGSRGCIGNCSFCTRNMDRQDCGQIFRSIEDIVQEITFLVEKYECKYIGFSDSTFCGIEDGNEGYARLKKFYELLAEKDFRIEFFINLRAEQITDRVVKVLEKLTTVGLSMIFLGIESFNSHDLKLYNKISTVETNVKALNKIKNIINKEKYFLNLEYGFMNFNPYSTIDDIKNNIKCLKDMGLFIKPDILTSYVDVRYGTTIYEKVLNDHLCSTDIDMYHKSVPYKFVNKDVEDLFEKLKSYFKGYSYEIASGAPSLYNRYIYFLGNTSFSKEFISLYKEFFNIQTEYCYRVFTEMVNWKEEAIKCREISILESLLEELYKKIRLKYSRLILELKKINELSYF